MSITIYIPMPLRPECGGAAELQLTASTVRAVLEQIETAHPALYRSVCEETGAVRRHVNLFVNEAYLEKQQGLDTALKPGDTITIMPAVSGG